MTTINLYQGRQENSTGNAMFDNNKGFVFSLIIIAATLLAFFAFKIYIPILTSQNAALDQNIKTENEKLVGLKNLENVVDTQNRLSEIKNNLQIKNGEVSRLQMNKVLDNLSGELNPGVSVNKFDYTKNNVTVEFISNSFNDIAKQINNLKKSNYFSAVVMNDISRSEKGISCKINMEIK